MGHILAYALAGGLHRFLWIVLTWRGGGEWVLEPRVVAEIVRAQRDVMWQVTGN